MQVPRASDFFFILFLNFDEDNASAIVTIYKDPTLNKRIKNGERGETYASIGLREMAHMTYPQILCERKRFMFKFWENKSLP